MADVAPGVLGGIPNPAILAGGCSVTFASLPPELRLPRHVHERATLNVVLEGRYGEAIERRAMETHEPGTLIAKPAGAAHENRVGSALVECLVIEPADDAAIGDIGVRRSARIAHLAGRLRAELVLRDEASPLATESLALELLAEARGTPRPRALATERWTLLARDLLHDEPSPRSLSELARRMELHPIYLARAFRARFGCSVGEYVRCLRLERARRLLHHTDLALASIAQETGYSDQSHMTREFRHVYGRSPGAYRRLAQVP